MPDVVVDGMQGGTAAAQEVFIEHLGIPTLPATRMAVEALKDMGLHREVQLIVSGGIRTAADVAQALALGADAVSIGTSAGCCDDYQQGRDPSGISIQDPELGERLDPRTAGRRVANYLRGLTLETQTLARATGKSDVRNLEPEDLVALTVEAAAMAKVPLAGTEWVPGVG